MTKLLMPKATAVWLIDNTALTFEQISLFTGLHELEVKALADGEIAAGMQGMDPIRNGHLTLEEIRRCEKDTGAQLKIAEHDAPEPEIRARGPRYTPLAKRADKPDGIAWLLKHHPELTDAQITRLIGTTKNTITAIRDRTHWNVSNLTPRSPAELGLCGHEELVAEIEKALKAGRKPAEKSANEKFAGAEMRLNWPGF